ERSMKTGATVTSTAAESPAALERRPLVRAPLLAVMAGWFTSPTPGRSSHATASSGRGRPRPRRREPRPRGARRRRRRERLLDPAEHPASWLADDTRRAQRSVLDTDEAIGHGREGVGRVELAHAVHDLGRRGDGARRRARLADGSERLP